MGLINYLGESKIIKKICELLNVTDVKVDGVSVVDSDGVANITGGGGASALDDLTDVSITTPTDYQALVYNDTDDEWENSSLDLNFLSDVSISSPSNNQILKYNSTSSKWENKNANYISTSGDGVISGNLQVKKSGSATAYSKIEIGSISANMGYLMLYNYSGQNAQISYYGSDDINVWLPTEQGQLALTSEIPTDFVHASTGGTFEGDISIVKDNSTTTSVNSVLTVGNNIADGTEGATQGVVTLYGKTTKKVDISADLSANDRVLYIPNASGYFVTASAHYGKSVSNTANETWKDFLNRLRSAYFSDGMVRRNVLRFSTLDGQSNFILHCDRFRNQDTSVWSGFRIGPNGIVFYSLSFGGSSTVVLRKGACNTSNVTTVEDITEDSQGNPTKVSTSADAVTITVL